MNARHVSLFLAAFSACGDLGLHVTPAEFPAVAPGGALREPAASRGGL